MTGETADEFARYQAHVARTAHDLSNVLGAVLNYAAFLGEDLPASVAAHEYLPHLQRAAKRAVELVDQLTVMAPSND
jgi:signal transduction histidine kinase